MLTLQFKNLPPMPRNRSHMLTVANRRPMNIKTPLCREFEKDVMSKMEEFSKECQEFKNQFNPKKHYISAEYYIFTPRESLFTVNGNISSRSVDLDAHKVFQDTIFRYIDLDDKLVRDVKYFSPVSYDNNWNYIAILKLENLCNLENMYSLIRSSIEPTNDDSMSFALL